MNGVFYHYCSIETFYNIVRSKHLRLCNSNKMNDYLENKIIYHYIEKYFDKIDINKLGLSKEEFLLEYKINDFIPYISSFSEKGDLLSQWRAYSDDGKGIAIGFDINNFEIENRIPIRNKSLKNSLGYNMVIYDEVEQNEIITNLINEFNVKKENEMFIVLILSFKVYSMIFKNQCFNEEKELRIIYSPDKNSEQQLEKEFYVKNGDVISYYMLDLKEKWNEKLVPEIILGPKCSIDPDDKDLKEFLIINGLKDTKVKCSKATYR